MHIHGSNPCPIDFPIMCDAFCISPIIFPSCAQKIRQEISVYLKVTSPNEYMFIAIKSKDYIDYSIHSKYSNNRNIPYTKIDHLDDTSKEILLLLLDESDFIKVTCGLSDTYYILDLVFDYIALNSDTNDHISCSFQNLELFQVGFSKKNPYIFPPHILGYIENIPLISNEITVWVPNGWTFISYSDDNSFYLEMGGGKRIIHDKYICTRHGSKGKKYIFTLKDEITEYPTTNCNLYYRVIMSHQLSIFQLIPIVIFTPALSVLYYIVLLESLECFQKITLILSYSIILLAYYYTYISLTANGYLITQKKIIIWSIAISIISVFILFSATILLCENNCIIRDIGNAVIMTVRLKMNYLI